MAYDCANALACIYYRLVHHVIIQYIYTGHNFRFSLFDLFSFTAFVKIIIQNPIHTTTNIKIGEFFNRILVSHV